MEKGKGETKVLERGGEKMIIDKIVEEGNGLEGKMKNDEGGFKERLININDPKEGGMKSIKGGVSTWKRLAREKENTVPVAEVKKRLFNDLTNGDGTTMGNEFHSSKKGRRGDKVEVAAIKKLPHNTRRGGDRWAWSLTSHGGFSVKTAYHAIHSLSPRLSLDEEYSQFWKKIWRMKTLPSTKHFVWRVAKNILPTGEALERRGVDIDGMCGMCGEEAETGIPAIIGCNSVQHFWSTSGLQFVNEIDAEVEFKEWLNTAMAQWDSKDLELFAIAAQKVWERRNKARFGEGIGDISGLWGMTVGVWNELNGDTRPREEQWDKGECARWQPHTWRFLKLNVDASYKVGSTNRIGCIIRDYTGRCLAAQTKCYVMEATVDIMEALAVFDGLEMAIRMSIRDIIVEGDSLRVFNLLNGKGTDNTYLRFIIDDILKLSIYFHSISFVWIRRDVNKFLMTFCLLQGFEQSYKQVRTLSNLNRWSTDYKDH
ncbi:reverse transcriptase [Senna tora]|uniref:Reverse transcriptase n=1 Tax=Senna tora TaxID=362788 RepID=A0A834X6Q4_9FABA|nr:reverse transcriptase [Senna tora]